MINEKIIKKDENLAKYSNFKTGGNAEYLFIPNTQEELLNFLKTNTTEITIIGAGSNILIRDGGIRGTVIITKNLNNITINDNTIISECGTTTSKLFNIAKNNNIAGFEFLACIPGTVGGACKMNAGCYNNEIKDILINIKTTDFKGNIKTFSVEECNMQYRKNNLPENLIFLEATFAIKDKKDKKYIENIFQQMLNKKISTQPINEKTCGSTFKNIDKIPAWKIIQNLGLQNIDYNGVKFSEKHANFLLNINNKFSKNIENLIDISIEKAKKELNINLDLEIKIIGDR